MGECCFLVPVSGLASDGPVLTLGSSRSGARRDGQGVRGRGVSMDRGWAGSGGMDGGNGNIGELL